jgi:hypothetical protein
VDRPHRSLVEVALVVTAVLLALTVSVGVIS